jgi:putative transposase
VVRCPKYGRQVLVGTVRKRLKRILREVTTKCQAELIELEAMPDHVHALVEVHPQFGIHRLAKAMKGRGGGILKKCDVALARIFDRPSRTWGEVAEI